MSYNIQFGCGAAVMIPSATAGNPPNPAGPRRVLTLQEVDLEITQKLEKLMGQNKFPEDVAPSDIEVKGKSAAGKFGIDLYNLMFGETAAALYSAVSTDEGPTAIPGSPFTITVTNSATFSEDLGVINQTTGQPMQQVASGPAAGQYSVSAGVYTFASADHTSAYKVQITYSYNPASGGRTLTLTNRVQGYGPVLEMWFTAPYSSSYSPTPFGSFHLHAARISKMGAPMKRNGYFITPIEFEAFADASNNIMDFYSAT